MAAESASTRRPVRPSSVRTQILASMLLVAAAGMAVSGATAYLVQRERTLADIDDVLVAAADEARVIAAESGGSTLVAVMESLVQNYRPGTDQTTLGIVDGAATYVPAGELAFDLGGDAPFVDRVVSETADDEVVLGTSSSPDRAVRYIAIPVLVEGDATRGVFTTAIDRNARLRPIDDAFRTFAVVAFVSLAIVGLVGWAVAGRLLRPLRSLRDAAARITATDATERIPVVGRDDVSELTTTVNGMLDRLDSAISGQRRLLDDVGHELKTPLTIVRGHLELMDATDALDVESTRALAIDELDRMNRLVGDISALAELGRPLSLTRREVDVAALTEQVHAKASALASNEWALGDTARVRASVDPERITQALLQLAANAVKYGAPAGRIEIGSAATRRSDGSSRVSFWVQNEGDGIGEETQRHIFERFRRGSRGRGETGSGLGLAIVSAIAAAHDGTVGVISSPGRGARFTMDLPSAAAVPAAAAHQEDLP